MAVDSTGNVFVADAVNNVIRKIATNGTITIFAGSGVGAAGNVDNADPTVARFSSPQGLAIDGANNLYVADTGNNAIRVVTAAGAVTTLAGPGGTGSSGASGYVNATGGTARFSSPIGIAADRAGTNSVAVNVFVADSQNNAIRQIVVNTGVVTTLAGSTTAVAGATNNSNNVGTDARFSGPAAVATNLGGTTVYVADRFNSLIRQIVISGANVNVSTLAGTGAGGYGENATGTLAAFNQPTGVTFNPAANTVLVADTLNQVIRSITTAGATSLMAGSPNTSGSADGLSTNARFNIPSGITVSVDGTVAYVVDTNNQIVRKISAATAPTIVTQPASAIVASGNNATFTVAISPSTNPTPTYQWERSTDSGGSWQQLVNGVGGVSGATTATLNISGVTTALTGSLYRVVITNGAGTITSSGAASLTVQQAPAITSVANATFVVNQGNTFQVVATGVPAPTITVSGVPSNANFFPIPLPQTSTSNQTTATISGTPTTAVGSPYSFTVTASNGVGSPATQTFSLTVSTTTPPSLSTVGNQQLGQGATTATFNVSASGTPNSFTYQWERSTDNGGSWGQVPNGSLDNATFSGATTPTLSISGITPNLNGNKFRVVVTSTGGVTTSNPAATLSVPPVITSAANYTFVTGQGNNFSFTANGNPSPSITVTPSGTLPNGVNLNGTFLDGTPTDSSATTFMTVTATNSGGTTTQNFTLSVSAPQLPSFTSASSASFNIGQAGSFTFSATGSPTPAIQLVGSLPAGVSYNPTTGVLSGTPSDTNGSPFTLTAQATNTSGTATQIFTLTVLGVSPAITSHPSSATANIGQNVTFGATATGTPAPTYRWQRQPSGTSGFINLTDDGVYSGTGSPTLTINGVTAAMSLDQFRVVATNGTAPDATSNPAQLNVNLGTVISTLAGQPGFIGSADGPGVSARFNSPSHIAVDTSGNVYIADTANHVIRKMTSSGVVTTLAGLAGITGSNDGTGTEARFNSPQGVAADGAGNVYVADTFNHTIRQISPGGTVTTIAGTAGFSGAVDANGATARFFGPTALAVDNFGTVYVSDTSNHAIRRISSTRDVTTFAGVLAGQGFADGGATSGARFTAPGGLALDSSGNLYVADSLNQIIRRISGGNVTTLAGVAGNAGVSDGVGANARFNRPTGIAVDNSGNLYVTDTLSSTIRKIVINTAEVTTIAGAALSSGSTDGAGSTARFSQPVGIAIDYAGTLYIADTRNHTIRRSGSPIGPQIQTQPVSRVAAPGQSVSFTASATGAPLPGYQWQRAAVGSFDNFVSLSNDGTYSGVTTSTLTISGVNTAMNGDKFRVVANNGVPSAAVSNSALLTVGVAPTFTSGTFATFQAGQAGSFTVTATSDPAATFTATGLPPWANLNPTTGEITGTAPDTSGTPFTVTVTASNPVTATQQITINVTPAVLPPTIVAQPGSASVDQGQSVTFSVTAAGTAPLSYQWRQNGAAIAGATGASFSVANAQTTSAGNYSVVITNAAGTVVSNSAQLVVNTPPTFASQPRTQSVLVGTNVTFDGSATGGAGLTYQWRKNGIPIAGATNSTLNLFGVTAADAANYDVVVTNGLGLVNSSLAQLTIATGPSAPVITARPASRSVLVGATTTLTVAASGVPTPTYQWRRNGSLLSGATNPTLTINSAQAGDAGDYDVVVSNASGSVTTSPAANVRVITRSYAGTYFGSFSNSLGNFAMLVRDDNTGVFLGYLPGSNAPIMNLNITVSDAGTFSFSQGATTTAQSVEGEPARAAALAPVTVTGTIGNDGSLSGSVGGGANATLGAVRSASTGNTQNIAGFYQAGATNGAAAAYTIASANGLAFVVVQGSNASEGGLGAVSNTGQVSVVTSRSSIIENISTAGLVTGSSAGAVSATLAGGSEAMLARQRLVNISSRARVGTGDAVAIAGFVISGEESKPVLIRAVGPTIGAAPFNVSGALASPRLELFRGSTSLAVNTGIAANRATIDAAGQQAGAFALGASGADAAILTTLPPGNYTAVVSSSTNTAGVALVEVYDLSAATPGQKLLNIATRASAGTADNTLIAGFVVPPGSSKRVLVRGVGPGLTPFGVTGVLAQPQLQLLSGSTVIAQNTNWNTSADAAALPAASAQVGAFGLANNDSALIVTLAPGNYTAQVLGVNNTTGVALIEVYEMP